MPARKTQRVTTQYVSGRTKLHVDEEHFRLTVPGNDRVLASEVEEKTLRELVEVLEAYFRDRG